MYNVSKVTQKDQTGAVALIAEYTYRPDGLRHSKTITKNGVTLTHTHIWDGANIVAEIGATGAIVARYLRGLSLIAREQDGACQYYFHNAHGDVVQRIDALGNLLKNYDYDAFGNEQNPVESDSNPFRYCGEYWDKETETIYLRNRSYNPSSGRFTSEDPIRAGANWYNYCENNPILKIDPAGLESYVFYDPHIFGKETGKAYAEIHKKELEALYGTDCKMIAVSSREQLKEEWDKMGNNGQEDVDGVVMLFHGNATGMGFKLFEGDGEEYYKDHDLKLEHISQFDQQNVDTLVILTCNAGKPVMVTDNLATAFMKNQSGIKRTIAADGNVTHSKKWFFGNSIELSTTVKDDDGKPTIYRENGDAIQGFKVYGRESDGSLSTAKPIKKPGYVFTGVKDLITKGKAKK